jgi:hypothetical protein
VLSYVLATYCNRIYAIGSSVEVHVDVYVEPTWVPWHLYSHEYTLWLAVLVAGATLWFAAHIGPYLTPSLMDTLAPGSPMTEKVLERRYLESFEKLPLEPERKNSRNDHADAAAARGGAHRFMTNVAVQSGCKLYDWFGSRRSAHYGVPTYRPLISPKDCATYGKPAYDPIPENAMIMLVNVAHWLTEGQIADIFRRGPTLLFETTPTAAGFTDCGIQHRFEDGMWVSEVPNNPYRHRLYNWEGETRLLAETPRSFRLFTIFTTWLVVIATAIYCLSTADYAYNTVLNLAGERVVRTVYATTLNVPFDYAIRIVEAFTKNLPFLELSDWRVVTITWWAYEATPAWYHIAMPYAVAISKAASAAFCAWRCLTCIFGLTQLLCGWGSVLVRIYRRRVTDHSTVLLIVPMIRWNAFGTAIRAHTFGPEHRLRELAPLTVTGPYGTFNYLRVVRGNSPDLLSISVHGTSCSVEITTEQETALLAQLRSFAQGRLPAGTTAQGALRRAEEFCERECKITPEQATSTVQALTTLAGAQIPRVPALDDHRSYTHMEYTYGTRDADTDDLSKNRMRAFMRPIIGTAPHADVVGTPSLVPKLNSQCAAASRELRKEQSRNHNPPSEADLWCVGVFLTFALESAETAGLPMGRLRAKEYEDILEVQNSASQRAAYQQVYAGYDSTGPCTLGEQTKPGEVTKKPRSIMPVAQPEHRMAGSRVAHALALVLKAQHWYGAVSPTVLSASIQAKADGCTNECEADATNRDGTHGWISRAIMTQLISRAFHPDDRDLALESFLAIADAIVRGAAGTYYNGNGLPSGVPWTTIMNSLGGAWSEFKHRVLSGQDPRNAYDALGLHAGDDCIMFSLPCPDKYEGRCWENGAIMKFIKYEPHSCRVTFLSRVWNTLDGSSGPCIARLLSKIHLTSQPRTVDDALVAAMKGLSVGYLDCGIPLFRRLGIAMTRDIPSYALAFRAVCAAKDTGTELPELDLSRLDQNKYVNRAASVSYQAAAAIQSRTTHRTPCVWYDEYIEEELGYEPVARLMHYLSAPNAHWRELPTIAVASIPEVAPLDMIVEGQPITTCPPPLAPTLVDTGGTWPADAPGPPPSGTPGPRPAGRSVPSTDANSATAKKSRKPAAARNARSSERQRAHDAAKRAKQQAATSPPVAGNPAPDTRVADAPTPATQSHKVTSGNGQSFTVTRVVHTPTKARTTQPDGDAGPASAPGTRVTDAPTPAAQSQKPTSGTGQSLTATRVVHTPAKLRLTQLKNDEGPSTAPTPAPWRAPSTTIDPPTARETPAVDPDVFPALPASAAGKLPAAPKGTLPTGRKAAKHAAPVLE